jgi:1-acyl-sn-glycerol-3-phosphate acyltransferase
LRGYITLGLLGIKLLVADLVQRTVVVALMRLRPSARERFLASWMRFLARLVLAITTRIGGARIDKLPRIPSGSGVLVLMNHQSLLDIPLVIRCLDSGYPMIVTRRRYLRGIPVVSHMLRLYDFPIVGPGNEPTTQVAALGKKAGEITHPLVIFPEGHRTRDGEIRPFKKAGLKRILAVRSWTVYVLVVDGLWRCGRLADFGSKCGAIRAQVQCLGPYASAPADDAEPFIALMRRHMCDKLNEIRGGERATTD